MTANFVPTNQMRYLRACMVCSYVQTYSRFLTHGCPNCEPLLDLANHPDTVQDCTSQVFEGLIMINDPASSWVARWQRLEAYVPGTYATKVVGTLPEDVVRDIEERGGRYVPRDGTLEDEDA